MRIRRPLIAVVLPVVLIAGPLAGAAMAHVEAEAPGATQGGSGTVTFSAEAEETTPLTKLEVAFPTDAPLEQVTVPPMDGWTSAVTDGESGSGQATVGRVTWTATGAGIAPEKTGEFAVEVGRFPAADQVVFKALVTYADGTVVSWIELQAPGGPEPDHPAPVLKLAPATGLSPATGPAAAPNAGTATAAAATVAITSAAPGTASAVPAAAADSGSASGISVPTTVASRRRGRTR